MTKKKDIFNVVAYINLFNQGKGASVPEKSLGGSEKGTASNKKNGRDLDNVLDIIIQQMKVSGYRGRTITDYIRYMTQFRKITNVEYLEEITTDTIYLWLDSMQVSNQTKLTRLKCLMAILGKCFNNGWLKVLAWH
ncbi:hypothetical protein AB0R87_12975 [Bacillus pumilus]|uniref:hypothetical protein n=1 Tax=Bacillus sp. NMCC46 TaxID=2108538 RepID=UPI001CB98EE7|nr:MULTISPECIES: hypothetical protein [Bacillus]MDR7248953.1 hypothetical protein [Bacillus pumilus]